MSEKCRSADALASFVSPAAWTFAAIDFETAGRCPESACAVGIVRVEGARVVRRRYQLLRPVTTDFIFTPVHGITAAMVAGAPTFAEAWPSLRPLVEDVAFLAAHNASFDRRVLCACCARAGLDAPAAPFRCTVALARRLGIRPAGLARVCARLNIPLEHHHALSDAEACAGIVLAAAGGHYPGV